MVSRLLRAAISIFASVFPLLYMYDYLKPLGLPSPFVAGTSGGELSFSFAGTFPLLPIGIAGITGFIIWGLLSQIGRIASMPSKAKMADFSQLGGLPLGSHGSMSVALPRDMTRSQYVVLRAYRQGKRNPKDVAKLLSVDKKEVEQETRILFENGYLTADRKLTAKGLEVVGA